MGSIAEDVAQKRQQKQNAKDKAITEVFRNLAKNKKTVVNALLEHDGRLVLNVGTSNSLSEYWKNLTNLRFTNIESLEIQDIENSEAFKLYKKQMSEQGYNVEITKAEASSKDIVRNRIKSGLSKTLVCGGIAGFTATVTMLTGPSIVFPGALSIISTFFGVTIPDPKKTKAASAKISLKFTERAASKTEKSIENNEENGQQLLDDLQQRTLKQATKQLTPIQ